METTSLKLTGEETFFQLNEICPLIIPHSPRTAFQVWEMLTALSVGNVDRAKRPKSSFEYENSLRTLFDAHIQKFRADVQDKSARFPDGYVFAFFAAINGYPPTTSSWTTDTEINAPLRRLSDQLAIPPRKLFAVLQCKCTLSREEIHRISKFFCIETSLFKRIDVTIEHRFHVLREAPELVSIEDVKTGAKVYADATSLVLRDRNGAEYYPPITGKFYGRALAQYVNNDDAVTLAQFFPKQWQIEYGSEPVKPAVSLCKTCGDPVVRTALGTTHHARREDHPELYSKDGIDHDKDADHVAIPETGDEL